MLKIIESGPLNTVQDVGRFGVRRFGVGVVGPMDPVSFRLGNMLVGNADEDAGIEIQTYPFIARIMADTRIAVTGGGAARLDGVPLPAFWSGRIAAGQVLNVSYGPAAARSYLCVSGGLAVPTVLGSRSTQLSVGLGGLGGRALVEGDEIGFGRPTGAHVVEMPDCGLALPMLDLPSPDGAAWTGPATEIAVRALPGGEYALFSPATRSLFWSGSWTISQFSNRAGYRLDGEPLLLDSPKEMRSHGVVPGVVQVPPAGQPIVQMMDGNTVGGYPKIAHVIEADLWRLGQASPRQRVRFMRCSYEDALSASDAQTAYLRKVRLGLDRMFSVASGRR